MKLPFLNKELTNTQLKLVIVGLFLLVVAAFFLAGGAEWLTLESIQANRDRLLQYADRHPILLFLGFGLVYTASTALSLPGGTVLSLAVGLVFGRWTGTLLIVIFATLGAGIVFLAARFLFAEAARRRIEQSPMAAKLLKGFQEDAFNYLLFLRLVPLFPFWLVNLAPAFTAVSTRTYLVTTAVGIIPGSFVYANLGQSLGRISSLDQLVSFEVLAGLALLGVLALVPVIIKKFKLGKYAGDI
ncbi:MAG: TVP38/TMEM64 family protein [Pseudomonadota bacterium]